MLKALRSCSELKTAAFCTQTGSYFFGFLEAVGATASGFFWSPKVLVSGQILKAGHFLQPTAMAMGQMVMGRPRGW